MQKYNRMNVNTILIFIVIIVLLFRNTSPSEPKTTVYHVQNQTKPKRYPMFNYNTQRVAAFTQIGILYKHDSNLILPLYGRRTYARSNTWNYYTSTNDDYRIRLELNINNRDCSEKTGCKELYTDDSVYIPEYSSMFKVKIYN